jgi:predicted kinase
LIVTGPSGSGKSTLAVQVATALGWPLLAKDVIKESLADSFGLGDEAWSHRLSDASLDMLFVIASGLPDAVIEGNFKVEEDSVRVAALLGRKLQIFCTAPTSTLIERVTTRAEDAERHPIHEDAMNPDQIPFAVREQVEELGFLTVDGPRRIIDTSGEMDADADADALASWVRSET